MQLQPRSADYMSCRTEACRRRTARGHHRYCGVAPLDEMPPVEGGMEGGQSQDYISLSAQLLPIQIRFGWLEGVAKSLCQVGIG